MCCLIIKEVAGFFPRCTPHTLCRFQQVARTCRLRSSGDVKGVPKTFLGFADGQIRIQVNSYRCLNDEGNSNSMGDSESILH